MEGLSGSLQLKRGGRAVERRRARRKAASEQLPKPKQADQAGEHPARAAAPGAARRSPEDTAARETSDGLAGARAPGSLGCRAGRD